MSVTTPPTIGALPTPPTTADPTNFASRADAFLAALPTLQSEANALADNVYDNAVDAAASATSASGNAVSATASASAAAASAGAALWVSGTTYSTVGTRVISPANGCIYRRLIAGAGTTDPSADATNWALVDIYMPTIIVTGTSVAAVAGYRYVLTNVAATTVTAPASPAAGQRFRVVPANGLLTNVINWNSAKHENISDATMTLDMAVTYEPTYISAGFGWKAL